MSRLKHSWNVPKKLFAKYESGEYRTVFEHGQECLLLPLQDVFDMWEELHRLRKKKK